MNNATSTNPVSYTTDKTCKIKFKATKEGVVYCKWAPATASLRTNGKWTATLDVSSCKKYKETKES